MPASQRLSVATPNAGQAEVPDMERIPPPQTVPAPPRQPKDPKGRTQGFGSATAETIIDRRIVAYIDISARLLPATVTSPVCAQQWRTAKRWPT
jgi:hypothetical protein